MLLIVADSNGTVAVGWAAGLFAVTAFTDFLDGYLARKWDATSTLGAFLDSTADKLFATASPRSL